MRDETIRICFISGFFLWLFSLILPAFSEQFNLLGYQTAMAALVAPFSAGWESNFVWEIFFRTHLLFLGLHNFILLLTMIVFHKLQSGRFRWLSTLYLISFFNTILFFFMNWLSVDYEKLLIGYYVWVAAGLFVAYPAIMQIKLSSAE